MRTFSAFAEFEVVTERFLDHDAAPALVGLDQIGLSQRVDQRPKEMIRGCKIEQHIVFELLFGVYVFQMCVKILKRCGFREISLQIGHPRRKPVPRFRLDRCRAAFAAAAQKSGKKVVQILTPCLVGLGVVVDANQRKMRRQESGFRKIVERRHDQAFGQVAVGAEDHHGARRRRLWQSRRRGHFFVAVLSPPSSCPSTCPPNWLRIADRSFSPNVWSWRERKRV